MSRNISELIEEASANVRELIDRMVGQAEMQEKLRINAEGATALCIR